MKRERTLLHQIYNTLLRYYGKRNWWPGETRTEIIIGAILTQNVSWRNTKKVIDRLKKNKVLNLKALREIEKAELAPLLKETRFYNQKAGKIKNFIDFFFKEYNGSYAKIFSEETEELRKKLLGVKGIGKETADCILLYAGNKLSFPSDAYTKRIFTRVGLIPEEWKYDEIREYFMKNIEADTELYNDYHAQIVHHGNQICNAIPKCNKCPIRRISKLNQCEFAKRNSLR